MKNNIKQMIQEIDRKYLELPEEAQILVEKFIYKIFQQHNQNICSMKAKVS